MTSNTKINRNKALKQFMDVYNFVSSEAMVWLAPTSAQSNLQDSTFVAELAFIPPHMKEPIAILMNTSVASRKGEEEVGFKFFNMLGYNVIRLPEKAYFEGQGDLHYLRDNIYFSGWGIRTSYEALKWLSENLGMFIIPMHQGDKKYYHSDLIFFPLTSEKIITCPELFSKETIQQIEAHAEIIPIDRELIDCNTACCIRIRRNILCSSQLYELKKTDERYEIEKRKIKTLTKITADNALEPKFFNISEMENKSGAGLACLFLNLNSIEYEPDEEPTIDVGKL